MKESTDDVTQFHSVDQTTNPQSFVQFMDTSHAQRTAQSYKQAIMEQLALQEGATILDVGCGTGQDTQDLARAVGPHGRVVGIDSSETMLQKARARVADMPIPVEYVLADATQLPFADASFDGCQASRVFGHLREPGRALAEMVRVARPGARIVVADGDMDLIAVDIPDRALARKVTHVACDQMVQGWMGRQMPRLFKQAGLRNIWVEGRLMPLDYAFFQMAFRGILQRAQAAGAISAEELTRFWNALEQAEQEQHFFARVGGFVISGRKPE
ncbi:MAG TPA: methyltransferase domain-containing protein [Ktedonobacteraceae bacterium]|jgi:ubiquinone/menaquinone biosynthesis C-methylase UbiE|nr:methyltransferase domain-containing protein [Ktedonobacteraceae bacterium]